MGRKYDFKYIVIGGGPAGTAAALTLAKAKKKVLIIHGDFVQNKYPQKFFEKE